MNYKIIYSNRRTVGVSIRDGEVTVKAPYGTSKDMVEKLLSKHAAWIEKHIKSSSVPKKIKADLTDEEIAELRVKAKRILSEKTERFANIMGLEYGRITITNAKTRFGSCSAKRDISYSLRLMLYPEEAIDYVVVHELAHTVEMNHSKSFYQIIERVFPDYNARRKLLSE